MNEPFSKDFDWLLECACPQCGRLGVLAGVLWGMPAGPPTGNVVLGGCVGPNFHDEHCCTACSWMGVMDRSGRALTPTVQERILGCLLGGAIGDALGAPVEFVTSRGISAQYPAGIRDYLPSGYGTALGLITDDTQMTLFTLEALLRCDARPDLDPMVEIHRSYLQWWDTQHLGDPPIDAEVGSLSAQPWLYARRAPGTTCLSALTEARSGWIGSRAANASRGCGAVMRSAPFGFVYSFLGAEAAVEAAALTHGHPDAQVSAGALAHIVGDLCRGVDLGDAVQMAASWAVAQPGGERVEGKLRLAMALATAGGPPSQQIVESLGEAWVGDEALAIAVYCALAFGAHDQLMDALALSVSHGGDSDSTGAICGNILGTLHGVQALPTHLVDAVEGKQNIIAMGEQAGQAVLHRLERRA